MNIDATIIGAALGLLNIGVVAGGGFLFTGKLLNRVGQIENDVRDMKNLLVSAAVHSSRIDRAEADIQNIDHDLRNLRRGVGWIRDEGAPSLNREYGG